MIPSHCVLVPFFFVLGPVRLPLFPIMGKKARGGKRGHGHVRPGGVRVMVYITGHRQMGKRSAALANPGAGER